MSDRDGVEEVRTLVKEARTKLEHFKATHSLYAATLFVPSYLDPAFGSLRVLAATADGNLFEYERVPAGRMLDSSGKPRHHGWPSLAGYAASQPGRLIRLGEDHNAPYSRFPVFGLQDKEVCAYAHQQPMFVLQGLLDHGRKLPDTTAWRDLAADLTPHVNGFNDLDPARFMLNLLRRDGDTGGVVCTDITNSSELFKYRIDKAIRAIDAIVRRQEAIAREQGGFLLTSSGDGCVFLFPMSDDQPMQSGSVAAIRAAKTMVSSFGEFAQEVMAPLLPEQEDIPFDGERTMLEELLGKIRIRASAAAGLWQYSDSASPILHRKAIGGPIHRAGYLNQEMRGMDANALWTDEFAYERASILAPEAVQGFTQMKEDCVLKSGQRVKPWEWRLKG